MKAKANTVAKQADRDLNDPNSPSNVQADGAFSRAAHRNDAKRGGRRKTSRSSGRR